MHGVVFQVQNLQFIISPAYFHKRH